MKTREPIVDPAYLRLMTPEQRRELGVLLPDERVALALELNERELQRQCESELSRRGICFLHLSFRAREKKGWPDLTFCFRDSRKTVRPTAVELKSPQGRLSDEQERMMFRMGANGWDFRVIRTFVDFRNLLNE